MSYSESLYDQVFPLSNSEAGLEDATRSVNSGAEGVSPEHPFSSGSWQEQLLPIAAVLVEEEVTVLQQELEVAHQLLQHQQRLIDALTQQLTSQENHLHQVEQDLEAAERRCATQHEQLEDVTAICQDLRSQLRHQRHRQLGRGLGIQRGTPLASTLSRIAAETLVVGYGSMPMASTHCPTALSSPGSTWSSPCVSEAPDPLTIYRQIVARMVTVTTRPPRCPEADPLSSAPAPALSWKISAQRSPAHTAADHRPAKPLELPSFA